MRSILLALCVIGILAGPIAGAGPPAPRALAPRALAPRASEAPRGAVAQGDVSPGAATPSGIPLEELEATVDAYVAEHLGVSSPGAAVVVLHAGEIVLSKGYGFADLAQGVPVDPAGTVFEYGSVSKLLVYITLMRLVEQGRIALEDDIRTYLPAGTLRRLRYDEPVTFLDVMNHQTGFEEVLFDTVLSPPGPRPTYAEAIRDAQPEQVYPPGTLSAYSNYAVALAAWIAQGLLAEQDPAWGAFDAYVQQTILEPLGMADAVADLGLSGRTDLGARRARGYVAGPNGFSPGPWSDIPLYPVGGAVGTAEDLARLVQALLPPDGEPSPLFGRRETLDTLLSPTLVMASDLGFAHGFIVWDGSERTLGHGGNTAAFSAQLNIVPESRFGVVVLANAAGEMALTSGLTDLLLGRQEGPGPADGVALPAAEEVSGVYIAARRMHNTFLRLYGYLGLLSVEAAGPDRLRLRLGGDAGTYRQVAPYQYERVGAEGDLFQYNFSRISFERQDGRTVRMSGDFVPLAPGSVPWLRAQLALGVLSAGSLLVGPAVAGAVVARRRRRGLSGPAWALLGLAWALVANNGILVLRMLADNYRSWLEVRPQIWLNVALGASCALACVLVARRWRSERRVPIGEGALAIAAIVFLALLLGWGFFQLLY